MTAARYPRYSPSKRTLEVGSSLPTTVIGAHSLVGAGEHPRFRGTGCYGMSAMDCGSLRLDVRRADTPCPISRFLRTMNFPNSADVIDIGSAASKPISRALICGISEDGVDFLVELVDDFGWCALWRADAGPTARLVARHEFSPRWERPAMHPNAPRWSPRGRAECPPWMYSIDEGHSCKRDLHLSAEQIGHDNCRDTERGPDRRRPSS